MVPKDGRKFCKGRDGRSEPQQSNEHGDVHDVHVELGTACDDAAENEDHPQDAGNQRGVVDGSRAEESDKADDVEKESDDNGGGDHGENDIREKKT